jgi:hypothetical protein
MASDEMIKHPLQGKIYPCFSVDPRKEDLLPPGMIAVSRIADPSQPFLHRPLLSLVSFSKTTGDQSLELCCSVGEAVQQVFHESFAKVLPEPEVRLKPTVKRHWPISADLSFSAEKGDVRCLCSMPSKWVLPLPASP